MKTYNYALDMMAEAVNKLRSGKPALASALLVKASQSKDLPAALDIIERSNAAAFKHTFGVEAGATQKETVAAVKRLKASAEAAAAGTKQVKAAKKLTAAQQILAELEGESEDMADIIGDVEIEQDDNVTAAADDEDPDADDEDETVEIEDTEADEEEDDEDEGVTASVNTAGAATIASLLASMKPVKG